MWFTQRASRLDSFYRLHSYWQDSPEDKGLALMVRRDISLPGITPPGDHFRSGP